MNYSLKVPPTEKFITPFDNCDILDLGRIEFAKAWELQLELVQKRAKDLIEDTLILCEHEPVYTFGQSLKNVPPGLPFPGYLIERGGKGTYHGPGQLVIYPIIKLSGPMITQFIRQLEQWLIDLLSSLGLHAIQKQGETGVWIRSQLDKKIASIGISVKRWVTFHGAALNVNPDLSHFGFIEPCGYSPETMTSVSTELRREIKIDEVKKQIATRNQFQCVEAAPHDP